MIHNVLSVVARCFRNTLATLAVCSLALYTANAQPSQLPNADFLKGLKEKKAKMEQIQKAKIKEAKEKTNASKPANFFSAATSKFVPGDITITPGNAYYTIANTDTAFTQYYTLKNTTDETLSVYPSFDYDNYPYFEVDSNNSFAFEGGIFDSISSNYRYVYYIEADSVDFLCVYGNAIIYLVLDAKTHEVISSRVSFDHSDIYVDGVYDGQYVWLYNPLHTQFDAFNLDGSLAGKSFKAPGMEIDIRWNDSYSVSLTKDNHIALFTTQDNSKLQIIDTTGKVLEVYNFNVDYSLYKIKYNPTDDHWYGTSYYSDYTYKFTLLNHTLINIDYTELYYCYPISFFTIGGEVHYCLYSNGAYVLCKAQDVFANNWIEYKGDIITLAPGELKTIPCTVDTKLATTATPGASMYLVSENGTVNRARININPQKNEFNFLANKQAIDFGTVDVTTTNTQTISLVNKGYYLNLKTTNLIDGSFFNYNVVSSYADKGDSVVINVFTNNLINIAKEYSDTLLIELYNRNYGLDSIIRIPIKAKTVEKTTYTATYENNINAEVGQTAKASVLVTNTSNNIDLNYSIYSTLREVDITITVNSGEYPSEIGWEILDNDGQVVISSPFGTYSSYYHYYTHNTSLEDGTYTFVAKDSYGDSWNGGYYTITDSDGNLIARGGDNSFGRTETKQFNIEGTEYMCLATGTITKNSSKQIEFNVPNSNTFISGTTNNVKYILTTDAAQGNKKLNYTINVTGGKSVAEVQAFSIKDAGVGTSSYDTISIVNKGNKVFNLSTITFNSNYYWLENVNANDTSIEMVLEFTPDSVGLFADTIVVALSDTTLNIPVAANGYGMPEYYCSNRYYSSNIPTITFGDANAKIPNDTLTIKNTGIVDLSLSIVNDYLPITIEVDSIVGSYVGVTIIDADDINNQVVFPYFSAYGTVKEVNGIEKTISLRPGKYALNMFTRGNNNFGKDGFVRITANGNTTTYKFDGAADTSICELGIPMSNDKYYVFEVIGEKLFDSVVIAPAKDTTLIVPLTWNIDEAGDNSTYYRVISNDGSYNNYDCMLIANSTNFAFSLSKPAFDTCVFIYSNYVYDTIWIKNIGDYVLNKKISYTNVNSKINSCYLTNTYSAIYRGDSVGIVVNLSSSSTAGTFEETITLKLSNNSYSSNDSIVTIPLKYKVENYYTLTSTNLTDTLNVNCGDTVANIIANIKNANSGPMTVYVYNNNNVVVDTVTIAANDSVNVTIPTSIKNAGNKDYVYAWLKSPQTGNNSYTIGSQVLYANATPSYEYNKSTIAMTGIAKNEYSSAKLSITNTGCININVTGIDFADGKYFTINSINQSKCNPNETLDIFKVFFNGSDSIATYTDTLFVATNVGVDTILLSAEVSNTKAIALGTTNAYYAYNAGKVVDLSLLFNSVITLIDTTNTNNLPSITMNTGRKAEFSHVAGNEMHFAYTVAENENGNLTFATNNDVADLDMKKCIVIDYNSDTVNVVATSAMVNAFNNLYRIKLDCKAAEYTTNANSLVAYYNDTVTVTFDFNEGVFGFVQDSIKATNATATLAATNNMNYTVSIVPQAEGEVTTNINLCVADSAGNITTEQIAIAFTYDVTAPVITLEANGNVSPVVFTVNVSEKIKALDDKKFSIKGGKITKVDVVNMTFTVEADADAKQIVLSAAEGAVTDLAGNVSAAASKTVELKSDAVTEQLASVSVYPNPATDYVNVVAAEGATIEVFAVTGAKVIVEQSNGSINRIDLTNLAAGNYIVRIVSNDAVEVKQITKE